MTLWTVAAGALFVGLLPCAWLCFRGSVMVRLVAVEASSSIIALLLGFLALAAGRTDYLDAALTLGFLSLAGAMVYVRTFERWL
ncbi:MAG TPA: monovalent cation/H+ antiporter complex subunit F [Longimicrobiales bacterium]|nr:monovalent cation/H+ antiporter complex subunit F [Longimicrobiales bacterium]